MVEGHRSHAAFMLFARAIDIEIAEAGHLRGETFGHAAAHHLVKQKFGIAVYIQRLLKLALFAEHFAFAVHRRAGSIEIRNAFVLTPIEQIEAVLVVVVHHIEAVVLHGIRAGTIVKNCLDIGERQNVFANLADKFVLIQIMRNFALSQIGEFFATSKIINGDNIGDAALVEGFDDVAADKTGRAGNDDGHGMLSSRDNIKQLYSESGAYKTMPV